MTLLDCFNLEKEICIAKKLLKNDETLPENVRRIIKLCTDKNIGFILSRNIKVLSCRDARSNRNRLGHIGIPLYDELKSIVFKGKDKIGNEKIIAAHCRGNMCFNLEAIAKICDLSGNPCIMDNDELNDRFGMSLGIVNPFIFDACFSQIVVNIFDDSLKIYITKCPGTMMTNAGEYTWGIEFDSNLVVEKISNKIVHEIAYPDSELYPHELPECINPKSIGIITGNGADSGIALWNNINRHFVSNFGEHFLGDISLPYVCVMSLPSMGLSMELDKRNTATWNGLSEAIKRLDAQGIELLSLACHTTHYYTKKIREIFEHEGRKFISMAEVVKDYVYQEKIKSIAILGIDFVSDIIEHKEYSAYSDLNVPNIELLPKDVIDRFRLLGYEVKKMNSNYKAFQKFMQLLKRDIKSKNVLIALTELSILYESQYKKQNGNDDIIIIDSLELYAKAIAMESMARNDERI
jgi:aspartate racemase